VPCDHLLDLGEPVKLTHEGSVIVRECPGLIRLAQDCRQPLMLGSGECVLVANFSFLEKRRGKIQRTLTRGSDDLVPVEAGQANDLAGEQVVNVPDAPTDLLWIPPRRDTPPI